MMTLTEAKGASLKKLIALISLCLWSDYAEQFPPQKIKRNKEEQCDNR